VDNSELIQGTPEWRQARCGCATASEFGAVLAKGQGKTRANYLRRIVAEILTGKPCETYNGPHLQRGQAQEPGGRMRYEAATGNFVEEVGFIKHADLRAGCSPDGLVDDDGGCEIKSVIPAVQVETILAGTYPSEHKPQVQGNLWITGRTWWDFVSYSPDMPTKETRLYIHRVYRDEPYIETLEAEVRRFLNDVDLALDVLLGRDRTEELLRASLAKVAA
jgi:hypothetical protein